MLRLLESGSNIRANKAFASFNEPPDDGDDEDAANQHDRPIHTRRSHGLADGPEEEEASEERIDNGNLHLLVSFSPQVQQGRGYR